MQHPKFFLEFGGVNGAICIGSIANGNLHYSRTNTLEWLDDIRLTTFCCNCQRSINAIPYNRWKPREGFPCRPDPSNGSRVFRHGAMLSDMTTAVNHFGHVLMSPTSSIKSPEGSALLKIAGLGKDREQSVLPRGECRLC